MRVTVFCRYSYDFLFEMNKFLRWYRVKSISANDSFLLLASIEIFIAFQLQPLNAIYILHGISYTSTVFFIQWIAQSRVKRRTNFSPGLSRASVAESRANFKPRTKDNLGFNFENQYGCHRTAVLSSRPRFFFLILTWYFNIFYLWS